MEGVVNLAAAVIAVLWFSKVKSRRALFARAFFVYSAILILSYIAAAYLTGVERWASDTDIFGENRTLSGVVTRTVFGFVFLRLGVAMLIAIVIVMLAQRVPMWGALTIAAVLPVLIEALLMWHWFVYIWLSDLIVNLVNWSNPPEWVLPLEVVLRNGGAYFLPVAAAGLGAAVRAQSSKFALSRACL